MRPIAVQLSCWRTLGISLYPFHVPQESKRLRISDCRPNIGTRNEARRPPPSTHHSRNRNCKTLVEAILLTGLCPARNSFASADSSLNACGPPGFVGSEYVYNKRGRPCLSQHP